MHELVLLRHGESTWNRENRFTGWTDVDLTEQGREEANRAARALLEAGYAFDVARFYRPYITVSYGAEPPPGPSELLFALPESQSSFVADTAAAGSQTALGFLKVYSAHEKVTNRTEMTGVVISTHGILQKDQTLSNLSISLIALH